MPAPDYEDLLYDDIPHPDAHPDRLATLATLFGLNPAPLERARVLELGCALGGNLLPIAPLLPHATFLGIDLSQNQIKAAQQNALELGLSNIDFLPLDILHLPEDIGLFDYIICHGVYSWVPEHVRDKILATCHNHLAPDGIAFISFNTYPGWHLRGMIRDILRRRTDPKLPPRERAAQAREILAFLAHTPTQADPANAWLQNELNILAQMSDAYLYYEHLVDNNHPIYFDDFVADAARHQLQYLADAHLFTMLPDRLGPEAADAIQQRSSDLTQAEQNKDLLAIRYFRRALLCHETAPIDRDVKASRLHDMWITTSLTPDPDAPESFLRPSGVGISTQSPLLQSALTHLAQNTPRGLRFDELHARTGDDKDRLARNLLGLYTQGQIELRLYQPSIATAPSPCPLASPFARTQAAQARDACTNLRHQSVAVDKLDRFLLARLDGTRDQNALLDALRDELRAGKISIAVDDKSCDDPEILLDILRQKLDWLARAAFLMNAAPGLKPGATRETPAYAGSFLDLSERGR